MVENPVYGLPPYPILRGAMASGRTTIFRVIVLQFNYTTASFEFTAIDYQVTCSRLSMAIPWWLYWTMSLTKAWIWPLIFQTKQSTGKRTPATGQSSSMMSNLRSVTTSTFLLYQDKPQSTGPQQIVTCMLGSTEYLTGLSTMDQGFVEWRLLSNGTWEKVGTSRHCCRL